MRRRQTGRAGVQMPLHTAEALVLRTYKLGEADRIVVFLTDDRGKRRGVAKGARRPRSPFAGGLEPLTWVRVAYVEHERRDLVRLRYLEPICSPLRSASVEALVHVGYFAELIDEWAPEADAAAALFRLGASAVQAIGAGVPVNRLARYVEYWLLRLQGVYPVTTACVRCRAALTDGGQLLPSAGAFVCRRCEPEAGVAVSAAALAFLGTARTVAPLALAGIELSPEADRQLATAHRLLIKGYLEKDLKSARVLRELLSVQG